MQGSMTLKGKRALVTGAGKRVGRAIAVALGHSGMQVAVHYRSSAREAAETCLAVEAAGGSAFAIQANLHDRSATRKLVDDAVAQLGGLDLLVSSAAAYGRVDVDAIDDPAWDDMLAVNLTAPFLLAQRATPSLSASKGSIVFITCSSVSTPYRNHLPYVVSKGALHQLMRVLSLELAPDVRVNSVAPGTVLPPEDLDARALERVRQRIPLQHLGTPEDIAAAVVYLASAPFVTGEELRVDGGRSVAAFETFG